VLGSTDGSNFGAIVGSAGYALTRTPITTRSHHIRRYDRQVVRVNITRTRAGPAGQISNSRSSPRSAAHRLRPCRRPPASLTFASQTVNTTSGAADRPVKNTGTATATVSGDQRQRGFSPDQ